MSRRQLKITKSVEHAKSSRSEIHRVLKTLTNSQKAVL